MGRPKKYVTEEERVLAKRMQGRESQRRRRVDPVIGPKQKEYEKIWRVNNPERHKEHIRKTKTRPLFKWITRNAFLQRKYGITLDQWEAMFEAQGQSCAVCKTKNPGRKGWQTDHCHKQKTVRGVLCSNCNRALGLLKEDVVHLQSLIRYLKQHEPDLERDNEERGSEFASLHREFAAPYQRCNSLGYWLG
jgi:hypothetical protein